MNCPIDDVLIRQLSRFSDERGWLMELFRNDEITPIIGYLGSSNLTLAGLSRQGELNIDVLEQDAAQKLVDIIKEHGGLKKTNIKIIPYYYLPSADGLRIVWIVKDEVTVSELIDGRLTIEKVWYPPIEGFKIYRVFSSGIAVYNHKALEVYWFPES